MHHRELFLTILHIGGLVSRRRALALGIPYSFKPGLYSKW